MEIERSRNFDITLAAPPPPNKIPATKTICLAQSLNRKDIFSILWVNLLSH